MYFNFPFGYTLLPPLIEHAGIANSKYSVDDIALLNQQIELVKNLEPHPYINNTLLQFCNSKSPEVQEFWVCCLLRYNVVYLNWLTAKQASWPWWHHRRFIDGQYVTHALKKIEIKSQYSKYYSTMLMAYFGSQTHLTSSFDFIKDSSIPAWLKNMCAFIIAPHLNESTLELLQSFIEEDPYLVIMSLQGRLEFIKLLAERSHISTYNYLLSQCITSKHSCKLSIERIPEFEDQLSKEGSKHLISFCAIVVYPEIFINYSQDDPWIRHKLYKANQTFNSC